MVEVNKMQLQQIMEMYFGRHGNLYLAREVKLLGCNSINSMDDETKFKLIDSLISHLFEKMLSRQKLNVLRFNMLHSLNLSKSSQNAVFI